MTFKSLTFTLEITVGTFNEECQESSAIKDFVDAITEAGDIFAKNMSEETGGVFIGNAKLLTHSETWE